MVKTNRQETLRDEITAKLISALESGARPWRQPWFSVSGAPSNGVSRRRYTGCNIWLLAVHMMRYNYSLPLYATFNQWRDKGCSVKARPATVKSGEWGSPIVFYSIIKKEEERDGQTVEKRFPMMRTWTVFNIEQVEGEYADKLREKMLAPVTKGGAELHADAERVIAESGIIVRHGGERAYYSPSEDFVSLPERERFHGTESYYGTMFHELVHATGHSSRLDRCPKFARFGSNAYAVEELVAELGGCFTSAAVGLPLVDLENHASYLQSWLQVLKSDNRAIFQASSAAQAASDYLLKRAGLLEEGQDAPSE